MSHLLEHMCFKGTPRRPTPQEVSGVVERAGGVTNAGTDRELTLYWCKIAAQHLPLALDVMTDIACRPLLLEEELEKERQVVLEELAITNEVPGMRAELLIDEVMWPGHPLGRDVAGTRESVLGIGGEAMRAYWRQQYSPRNAVLSVAGNVQHEAVIEALERCVADWAPSTSQPWLPAPESQTAPRLKLEWRRSDQAHLCLGLRGLPLTHPDRFKLDLLNTILGEGMSSRLFVELRERQGLAYDVHSEVNHLLDCGSLVVHASVSPQKIEQALQSALQELARIKERVPEEELRKGKEYTKGRLLLRMEDSRVVAEWIGAQELLMGQVLTVDEVVQRLEEVTAQDLQELAQRLLVREKLNLAVVGPFRGSRIESRLERLLSL